MFAIGPYATDIGGEVYDDIAGMLIIHGVNLSLVDQIILLLGGMGDYGAGLLKTGYEMGAQEAITASHQDSFVVPEICSYGRLTRS